MAFGLCGICIHGLCFLLVTRKAEDSFLMALIESWDVFFGCIFCGVVAFPMKL